MRSVTCSMGISLDGYIVGPDGDFDWTVPDEDVVRFVTDEIREVGVHHAGTTAVRDDAAPSASVGILADVLDGWGNEPRESSLRAGLESR
jgi:hypothetical protein